MNVHVEKRLKGIHHVLSSAFEAGGLLSSASKGYERETFIALFLSEILPPIYRFGTGDITDALANHDSSRTSGQIDIVIEMPWAPSFPLPTGGGIRLYPAEAVGTAIEVKSNIAAQWCEVVKKARKLDPLRQQLGGASIDQRTGTVCVHDLEEAPIPLYAVGYEGWQTPEVVLERLHGTPLDGILIVKPLIFAWSDRREHLAREAEWKAVLAKKRHGDERANPTQASCARLLELQQEFPDPAEMAARMNSELYSIGSIWWRDQEPRLQIDPGAWHAKNVEQALHLLSMKTDVMQGLPALLQFVAIIHREVAKRATMTTDLSRYAT
jgi:hypothetical protein